MAEQSVTRSGKSSSQRKSEAQSVSRAGKGDLQTGVYGKTTMANPIGRRYASPIGPSNRGFIPGGDGIMALNNIRMTPTSKAPKATPNVIPAAQVISNVTRERTSPAPSRPAAPARMGVTPATGKTTGFTSGTKTGTTMTKAGKAFKTAESAYQRQQRMALEKMGVAGPRGGTSKTSSSAGGMRSTGGGSRSSGGGAVGSTSGTRGYGSGGNVGRGDVGAGRRGGGR
jgi:hypothetical protein